MTDPGPLDREELEIFATAGRDIARMTKAQYDGFIEAGFSVSQALALTQTWLAARITENQ